MSTLNDRLLLKLAHNLIGVRGVYQGREFTLIEVLSGPSVVLEPVEASVEVQNTAQGEAKRYAQPNYTLPVYSEITHDLHPVLVDFLGEAMCDTLRRQIDLDAQS